MKDLAALAPELTLPSALLIADYLEVTTADSYDKGFAAGMLEINLMPKMSQRKNQISNAPTQESE